MKQKKLCWILILLLLFSLFPINIINVGADPPVNIYLITCSTDYTNFSFTDLGIYYTKDSLCEFHMPFIVERKAGFINLNKNDLDGWIKTENGNGFDKRFLGYDFKILDSNVDYYVIDFTMNTRAGAGEENSFSVDFVPKIKGVSFENYGWWHSSWIYKKLVTIDYDQVPSTLTNFPVLVYRATDSNLADNATADGGDIVFIDSAETTQYNHEIENYNNPNGRLVAWVNVTSVSHSADTTFYMYYGNGACADQWDADNTWDSNFTGVFHMEDAGGGAIVDSTVNGNDGTSLGTGWTPSKILGGQAFDGTNDNISFPASMGVNTVGTLECWVEPDIVAASQMLMCSYGDTDDWVFIGFYSSGNISFNGKYGGVNQFDLLTTETYDGSSYYVAGAWGSVNDAVLWVNGTSRATDTSHTTSAFTLTSGSAGTDYKAENDLDGDMDELRISNIRRSDDWLETCYNNQNNQTTFCTFGSEEIYSGVVAPTNFNASTESNGDISLTWTMGINATHTYIERSTSSSWVRGDGTLIYNNTGTSVTDDDITLACNIVYYYQGWSFNSTTHVFSGSASTNNITCPGNPSSSTATVWDGYLNVTWVKNSHADKTQLVRKTGSYPTTAVDGTVIYNGTLLYHNDSGVTTTSYYTLYSWNETTGRHSTGLQRAWGQLTISVYDENTSEAIRGWDVFISNSDKTETYESLNNSNPLIIDIGENLPYGTNTMIKINASGNVSSRVYNVTYDFKIYYMDIEVNNHYTLNAYLSLSNDTESYIIRIINEVSNPVVGASVQILRYINSSTGYQNVSIILTDGNGYCPAINLIPNEDYAVTITASGYITATYDLFPIPIVFADDRYHIYQISYTTEEYPSEETVSDQITFTATITRATHTLDISYGDLMGETTDMQLYIYEYNYSTETRTLWQSTSNTDTSNFTLSYGSIDNESRYTIVIYYNHSTFGKQTMTILIDRERIPATIPSVGDDLFDLNYGSNPFGWSNTFMWLLAIAIYFEGGQQEAGFYMIVAGIIMMFINYQIGFNTVLTTVAGGVIPMLTVIVGLGVLFRDSHKTWGGR